MISGLFAAVILGSQPTLAFEQTAPGPAPEAATPALPAVVPGLADDSQPTPKAKTEKNKGGLKIPGLGSINLLPKMDFGLELLYGEPSRQGQDAIDDPLRDDEVTIRGTVKRRF